MSYENSAGLGVSNHYGARDLSVAGSARGNDIYRQAGYAKDGDLVQAGVLPEGSIVTNIHTVDAGASVGTISVGAVDVSAADGVEVNNVATPLGGQISIAGTIDDGGKIILEYITI